MQHTNYMYRITTEFKHVHYVLKEIYTLQKTKPVNETGTARRGQVGHDMT